MLLLEIQTIHLFFLDLSTKKIVPIEKESLALQPTIYELFNTILILN